MEKVSYLMGQVGRLKVTFNVIVKPDVKSFRGKVYDKKVIEVVENPNTGKTTCVQIGKYIGLAINPPRNEEYVYDRRNYLTLSLPRVYQLRRMIKTTIDQFRVKDLFVYRKDRMTGLEHLLCNQEIARELVVKERVNGYEVSFMYAVVKVQPEGDTPDALDEEYEGVVLVFNDLSHSTEMTYDELCYFYDMLNATNYQALTMELFRTYLDVCKNKVEVEKQVPSYIVDTQNFNSSTEVTISTKNSHLNNDERHIPDI